MRTRPIRTRSSATVRALALLVVVLAACTATDDVGDTVSDTDAATSDRELEQVEDIEAADEPAEADADAALETDDGAAPDAEDANGSTAPVAVSDGQGQDGRHVVRSAQLVLEVEDSAAAADEVVQVTESAGGFVAESDLRRDDEGVVSGRLGLRIPADELDEAVDALDAIGDAVPVRRIDETDVTTEMTDLDSELTNLRAYEEQLRDLLGEVREDGGDAQELLSVFDRLNAIRADIERVEGRLTSLEDRVTWSRVDVELQPTETAGPIADPGWSAQETASSAVRATSRALTAVADVAIRATLTWLPIALVVVGPFLLLLLVGQRLRRRRDLSRGPGTTPPPPATVAGGEGS